MPKRRRRSSKRDDSAPGWLWMLAGLTLGLAVAAAVYVVDRRPGATVAVPAQPEPRSQQAEPEEPPPAQPARRSQFDFYEILPQFEVVIPESESSARPDTSPVALEDPGTYVLQAGSFSSLDDAERMRANLALLGIESRTQRVTIDDNTFHRVRVGPVTDLDRVNELRQRLREAQIEIMVIRLPDNA